MFLYMLIVKFFLQLMERNLIPDFIIRFGIRVALSRKLKDHTRKSISEEQEDHQKFIQDLKTKPIAIYTSNANEQHYELPTEFFLLNLGKNLKYSCALYENNNQTLNEAEINMFKLYIERAQLQNGQKVLDLGCGWGSLTLYLAQQFPKSQFTSISNSQTQREFILGEAKKRNLANVQVFTLDISTCDLKGFAEQFDRVLSIEMFEHMKNYGLLLEKISGVIKKGGFLFVHIFSHIKFAYHYEVQDESDWMAKYFFTGGTMPSNNLLLYFQEHLKIVNHWTLNGMNYYRTCKDWLRKLDQNGNSIKEIFKKTYGNKDMLKWFVRWRVFYLACGELFRFDNGNQWIVSHYLYQK